MVVLVSSFYKNSFEGNDFFKFGNKKKSHGTKSGKYFKWGL